MTERRVGGIDPGGRGTGVLVRSRQGVHYWKLVVRRDDAFMPGADYINEVVDAVAEAVAVLEQGGDGMRPWIGVERVKKPTGYRKGARSGERTPINPEHLIGVSMVLGGVLAVFPFLLLIEPGGRGSAPLRSYPQEIIGGPHNERWPHAEPKGEGLLRHVRSAFDVAGAVPAAMRTQLAQERAQAGRAG